MANLLAQSCSRRRRHGLVCYPNDRLQTALCLRHRSARPQRSCLDQRHGTPTAEWVARQITEAFPWNEAPRYMVRDHDRIYGTVVTCRLRAMGIREKSIAPASPWQNGFAEWL